MHGLGAMLHESDLEPASSGGDDGSPACPHYGRSNIQSGLLHAARIESGGLLVAG